MKSFVAAALLYPLKLAFNFEEYMAMFVITLQSFAKTFFHYFFTSILIDQLCQVC